MAGFTPPMSVGMQLRRADSMAHAIRRSIFFSEADDSDILEWLENHPSARYSSDLPDNHPAPSLLFARLLSHEHREVCVTIPSHQQIDFEAPTQVLGVEGMLVADSMIFIIADRIRNISLPVPNYYGPGNFTRIQHEESISIAFLFQRMVAGRVNGSVLSGSSFLLNCASIFGATTHLSRPFPDDAGMIPISRGRTHLHRSDVIADLRKFRTHLDSLAGFAATFQVVLHGLGFRMECSTQEAILTVTEVFFGSLRIPHQMQSWAASPPLDWVTDRFDGRSSIPSWLGGGG